MTEIYIVAGGDARFSAAAAHLAGKGHTVYSLSGIGSTGKAVRTDIGIVPQADHLILPVPVSADGKNLYSPGSRDDIPLDVLPALIKPGGDVFGGKVTDNIAGLFRGKGFEITDYTLIEEFSVRNAEATAEGAAAAAMDMQDITLFGQNILIIGWGRIGKALAVILRGFGADITIASRSREHIAWSKIAGFHTVSAEDMKKDAGRYSLVFNTAPAPVLDSAVLSLLDRDVLIIDLASSPGGTDFTAAKQLGLNVFHYTGIPGKTSPRSAGIIAAEAIENEILRRQKEREK